MPLRRLELYAGKLARTVLRGLGAGNRVWLPIMSTQCRVTANFRRADGKALHIRKATRAEPEQMAIYSALKVNPAPGGISKTIV